MAEVIKLKNGWHMMSAAWSNGVAKWDLIQPGGRTVGECFDRLSEEAANAFIDGYRVGRIDGRSEGLAEGAGGVRTAIRNALGL